MKRNDQDRLLDEILGGTELAALRQASLDAGLRRVRARARRLQARRIGIVAALPVLLAVALMGLRPGVSDTGSERTANAAAPAPRATAPEFKPIRAVTDEELFALFPNRSLALVGKPGSQRLIFLDLPSGTR